MSLIPGQGTYGTISRSNSTSSGGHISSHSSESPGLLSPNQLHRISPGHDQDATAVINHAENDVETTPSTSLALSKPSSVRDAKDARSIFSHHASRWKSLLSALGHYLRARSLDGTPTDTSNLRRSQVSAVSILLKVIDLLKGTVFQTARFQQEFENFATKTHFSLGTDLSITEDFLNNVLTNITLSALSLEHAGTWYL
ncbi:predicted protein [Plenodomus lingam JN3]|uniref:Predicted protein n=1 Tax=Leptosphaeria maculans (strain JN3 / isolate v23.1.3 / race Av1-4-5-6-7-8) TaxID=985895 RepID=E4ZJK9_LEPMJ|nr:predicted protein [Plenodomus lingam JN3]CBX91294.1 predicted protein [Plenodomus lingam JN3]